jgi:hypothetical protein
LRWHCHCQLWLRRRAPRPLPRRIRRPPSSRRAPPPRPRRRIQCSRRARRRKKPKLRRRQNITIRRRRSRPTLQLQPISRPRRAIRLRAPPPRPPRLLRRTSGRSVHIVPTLSRMRVQGGISQSNRGSVWLAVPAAELNDSAAIAFGRPAFWSGSKVHRRFTLGRQLQP